MEKTATTFRPAETIAEKLEKIVGPATCTFDIETLGRLPEHALVGIGAVIQGLTAEGEILTIDAIELCGGFVGTSRFERDCMTWWMLGMDPLENGWDPLRDGPCPEIPKFRPLIYSGPLSEKEREAEMVMILRSFLDGWLAETKARGMSFFVLSDNPQYDLGWLDRIAFQNGIPPFNYGPDVVVDVDGVPTPSRGDYVGCIDPTDMARGLLMAPDHVRCLGRYADVTTSPKSAQLQFLYEIPPPEVDHDHRPLNDATVIGWHYHAVDGISRGIFRRSAKLRSMTPAIEG